MSYKGRLCMATVSLVTKSVALAKTVSRCPVSVVNFRLFSVSYRACEGITLQVTSPKKAEKDIISNHASSLSNIAARPSGWILSLSRYRYMSSSSTASTLAEEISNLIDSNKVVIFSKSYCPYCSATKNLFQSMNVDGVRVVELDQDPRHAEMQDELLRRTGQHTVPNVFVNGTHVGGNSETQSAARSGKLKELLG